MSLLLGHNAPTTLLLLFVSQVSTFTTKTVTTAPKSTLSGRLAQAQQLQYPASTTPISVTINAWSAVTSIVTASLATPTSPPRLALSVIFNTTAVQSKPARFAMSAYQTV